MPGDLLVVEMMELGPLPGDEWGFTGTFDRDNGGACVSRCTPRARNRAHPGPRQSVGSSASACGVQMQRRLRARTSGSRVPLPSSAGGFLTDHFPAASKAIWNFEGLYCQSRHIPGVRFPGLIHPGLIGTAPSAELLEIWNTREKSLVDAGSRRTRVRVRATTVERSCRSCLAACAV